MPALCFVLIHGSKFQVEVAEIKVTVERSWWRVFEDKEQSLGI